MKRSLPRSTSTFFTPRNSDRATSTELGQLIHVMPDLLFIISATPIVILFIGSPKASNGLRTIMISAISLIVAILQQTLNILTVHD